MWLLSNFNTLAAVDLIYIAILQPKSFLRAVKSRVLKIYLNKKANQDRDAHLLLFVICKKKTQVL